MDNDDAIHFTLPIGREGLHTNVQPSSLHLTLPHQPQASSVPPLTLTLSSIQPSPAAVNGKGRQRPPAYPTNASFVGYDIATQVPVWFSDTARSRGLWILGKTGTGKTTFFLNLILQDITRGIGVCFVDPVGDAINDLVARIPQERLKDVVLLDILHPTYTFGLNLYAGATPTPEGISAAHERIMHLFRLLWGDKTNNDELGVWVRQYLSNSAFTLIENNAKENPCAMTEIPLLFRHREARERLVAGVTKQSCLDFWEGYETLRGDEREKRADTQLSRVDAFLGNYYAEQIVGQARTTVDFQQVMNDPTGKILLIQLSNIHKELSQLVGAVIIAQLLEAAKSRVALAREERRQFNVYADEYHLFATADWGEMVEQARKFNVCVNFGHQRMSQLPYASREGVLGTRNKAVFSISGNDAQEVAKEFDCSPQPGPPQHEQLKTPVLEPIQYVVQNKGVHPLPATRHFFEQYARQLVEQVEKEEQAERDYKLAWERYQTSSARLPIMPTIQMPTYDSRFLIKFLNGLFYQAMMAGKEGREPGCVADIICDYFIKVLAPYGDPMTYLELCDLHRGILSGKENPVRDHVVRKWMIDKRYAQLTAYKQSKLIFLQWEKDQAERVLREVYRRYLITEVSALREKIVLVRRGAYYYKPLINAKWREQLEQYVITAENKPNPEARQEVGLGEVMSWSSNTSPTFESWQAAVTFCYQGLQTVWFQVGQTLFQQSAWQYQRTRVSCMREVLDQQGRRTIVEVPEILDTWVLRPGVEASWYTWKMLDEEASRLTPHFASQTEERKILDYCIGPDAPIKKEVREVTLAFSEAEQKLRDEEAKIPEVITQEIATLENERDVLTRLLAAKPGYFAFIADLKQQLEGVMQELAKAPIEADSGLTREVPTEIPSSEVERRIANELARLPDLTARCVFHENDRPVERTIHIARLQSIPGGEVQQRLEIIEQNTIQAGFYRLRSEVQDEIQTRRQKLTKQQPPPAPQQSRQQQPSAPPVQPQAPQQAPPQKKGRKN